MKTRSTRLWNTLAGASLIIFLVFTYGVLFQQAWVHSFDNYWYHTIHHFATPPLTAFFTYFTKLGNVMPLIAFVVGTCLILLVVNHPKASAFLFINTLGLAIPVNTIIKSLINRPRPKLAHLVQVHSSSFPSGHSMSIMMLCGSLIIIVNAFLKKQSEKVMLDLLFIVMIILIGISRIYVGVHFASDVVGGWSLGFCLLRISKFVFSKIGGEPL
ncbi:phosphatase PAP2 family protein [Lentilactobacillus kisonensis]|uniref:PAP2 family protein n=1 Tax=Lentilactobacillus kisonensis F0435 TaxID=797516 RepID=H1LKZ2_9LACO|nr:phosphatase PAP2 family protein [Lentilactobacillus kisonensis]EHO45753.1 PAP2 family protein [Lentilactobacillus kisonensis F0435]